ncbi:beta-galactosidase [Paenibacillus sp. HJL G12]|uniref:Beta-galactosidase n=1 Tax=Paenibacillus dendrobii TaxID=2691084 RepID=A0A7X3IS25_9BACL|nr:sugar-binding domain-containing protein [Paenibacillus dendrobii]MWV47192.1 beta-galactosidase [Paenibacillus dendrobii]
MEERHNQTWSPVEGKLMTRWAHEVNPENVLPEYPRPQMVREQWMNLNGLWEYAICPVQDNPASYDGYILVPFPVESSLSGVGQPLEPDQRLWYRRAFLIPENWQGQRLLLHFGAVDWKTEVWVNGYRAGEHIGGYCPFTLEITDCLNDGDNELVVIVWDPTETHGQERGKQTLQPKGLFYTAVSGIWQTVWLEPVPQNFIHSFRLMPDIGQQELHIHMEIQDSTCSSTIYEAAAYEKGIRIAYGRCGPGDTLKLPIRNPRLWSPEDPFLYDLTIQLVENGQPVDTVESYFGMRSFRVEKDHQGIPRLCLNGQPVFQHGILDQGYWPDGLYTAPTDEALAYDIIMTKKLGFNMTRKHIKVEPARWYYHCDRLGLIVWQDMINGGGGWNHWHHIILPNLFGAFKVKDDKYKSLGREDPANREQYRQELKEMVDTLYNVPSIGMWVPFNEAWGQFDAAETAEWLMTYDPSRPVDHASGWHDQEVGQMKSVHIYFRKLRMPNRIKGRAVVISEYGGYSLLAKGHVWQEGKEVGYKRCRSQEELTTAYGKLIRTQLMPLIAKGVCAAVYTQLTDVETEINGLMTYDREVVKLDPEWLIKLHRELLSDCDPGYSCFDYERRRVHKV